MSPSGGSTAKLFSRDEILEGMSAGRGQSLLFAIENRTAMLVARSRRAMAWYRSERTDAQRERAFLQALADEREGHGRARPSIQDIDRYAPAWAELVPPDVELRAELAHRLGEKYRFTRDAADNLRSVLRLDDPETDAAHSRLHGTPLESIFAERLTFGERAAWMRAELAYRLENLPPFWTAFSLTLTGTVGAGVVALPIALAGVGPVPGALLLLLFGVVNAVTMAALVEAITRTGSMRYGSSYFGRLVNDLLGRVGSVTVTVALLILNLLAIFALATGFGSVLATASPVPAWIWVAVLFAVMLWILRSESLDSTVASALVIGAVNLVLIGGLVAIGLANVRGDLMASGGIPPFDGRPFDGSIVALVFGVILSAYFGHSSAANAAKVVLRRDPSGRALLWGSVSASLVAVVIYGAVVLAVNGAVPAERLQGFEGTAISPLAEVAGPVVLVVGAAYVVLAMGMVALNMALGLYNQAGELLDAWRERGGVDRAPMRGWLPAVLRVSPLLVLFVGLETLLLTGGASFAGPLNIMGALTIPLLGGAFPMLMLAAARRRGEYVPGTAWRVLGSAPVVWGVFALYVAAIALHGLVIWESPLERIAALLGTLVILGAAVAAWRSGSLRRRTVVELRADVGAEHATVAVVDAGRATTAALSIDGHEVSGPPRGAPALDAPVADARTLRTVELTLPAGPARELKIWTHRLTGSGGSEPWPADVEVSSNGTITNLRITEDADVVLERDGGPLAVRLSPAPLARSE